MATRDSLADRVFPVFDHTHDALTTGLVVGFAALLGLYTSWMVADFGGRFLGFAAAALASGYALYDQTDRRAVVAGGLYALAVLLAFTPFLYELAFLVESGRAGVGSPWRHVLSVADLALFVVFFALAAVPALAGYRLDTGPFLPRIRARLGA
jgi:hypothetical protein